MIHVVPRSKVGAGPEISAYDLQVTVETIQSIRQSYVNFLFSGSPLRREQYLAVARNQ